LFWLTQFTARDRHPAPKRRFFLLALSVVCSCFLPFEGSPGARFLAYYQMPSPAHIAFSPLSDGDLRVFHFELPFQWKFFFTSPPPPIKDTRSPKIYLHLDLYFPLRKGTAWSGFSAGTFPLSERRKQRFFLSSSVFPLPPENASFSDVFSASVYIEFFVISSGGEKPRAPFLKLPLPNFSELVFFAFNISNASHVLRESSSPAPPRLQISIYCFFLHFRLRRPVEGRVRDTSISNRRLPLQGFSLTTPRGLCGFFVRPACSP